MMKDKRGFMERGKKRQYREEESLNAIAKRALIAGSHYNALHISSLSEEAFSVVCPPRNDSEASSSSTIHIPKCENLPIQHASTGIMDAGVSSSSHSSCIMVEDELHEPSRMQLGTKAMHLDLQENSSHSNFSHSLVFSAQTCLSSITQSVSHSEAPPGEVMGGSVVTCRHDTEDEFITRASILRARTDQGNPGALNDTVVSWAEEKHEELGLPAQEALAINWEAGHSVYHMYYPFPSLSDNETMQSIAEIVSPKYVLSSGRLSMEEEAQLGRKIPTIDQEFEEYFAALML